MATTRRTDNICRFIGLGIATLMMTAGSCREDDTAPCEDVLQQPTPGFPTFISDPNTGEPTLDFQVCDSAVTDLNGDGLLDIVVANHIEPGFGYFMGEPSERVHFADGRAVEFVGGGNSAGIVVDDFNGDGIPDVANSDHPGIITIRINATEPGAAIDEVEFPDSGETNVNLAVDHSDSHGFAGIEGGLVGVDLNRDGKVDIATANLGENADGDFTASILLNTTPDPVPDPNGGDLIYAEASSFAPVQYVELPGAAISITTADYNGDGVQDIATSNTAVSSISVLTNFTPEGADSVNFDELVLEIPDERNGAGAGPTNPVTADFNNDGRPDIATANWNVDTVSVFTNTTSPTAGGPASFDPHPVVVLLCFNPLVVRTGDVDNDGDEDLIVIPLDLEQNIAFGVIENRTEVGAETPDFAFVSVVELPDRMQDIGFFAWLDGKTDDLSPGVWFTTSGNVADFDGDGDVEVALSVALGNFAIEIQGQLADTTDIMKFVVPPIDIAIAEAFLPRHTELLHYVHEYEY